VRSERFCDGAWQSTLKSGLMDELLATRTFKLKFLPSIAEFPL
jgi:hypothetical protein